MINPLTHTHTGEQREGITQLGTGCVALADARRTRRQMDEEGDDDEREGKAKTEDWKT